jgi:nitroreductase
MDAIECIMTRRSIRNYLEVPVEWDKIGTILDAGRFAPSSGNIQDFKFVVVKDEGSRKAIADACLRQYWMSKAPVHIVVCSEIKKSTSFYGIRGERLYSIQNCAAAIENMMLAANALGLGTCWVGAFDENVLSRVLGIPDYIRPQAIITIGYYHEAPKTPQRFPLTTVAFLEKYGNRIKDAAAVMRDYSLITERYIKQGQKAAGNAAGKAADFIGQKRQSIAEKLKKKFKK